MTRTCLFVALTCAAISTGWSGTPPVPGAAFQTPVRMEILDPAAYAQWEAGKETMISGETNADSPQSVIATTTTSPASMGSTFGDSKTAGPRHLRIGFREPVRVGSVLVKGGGTLSVLKPGAAYPGDLENDASWTPAQRLVKGALSREEVGDETIDLWVLPPGTTTRALRFTHVAEVTDLHYTGRISGALVLSDCLVNEAPRAVASASSNSPRAVRINNLNHDGWNAWENQEKGQAPPDSKVLSEENYEWVALTWPERVTVNELVALWAGFGKVEVQAYMGEGTPEPKAPDPAQWQSLGVFEGIRHEFPSSFWPNRFEFKKAVTTRSLRLRLTAPGQSGGPAQTNKGTRTWLGELMALRSLGDKPLEPVKTRMAADLPPPIPIPFTLKEGAFVTLVIEKPDGFRVRNLISETWFPAGDNIAWWDGTDDLNVDVDAAMHGLYRILGKFVEPGEYVVRGLARGKLTPHYEFSVYTTGNPPWNTPDSTGAWLANHSPPQAAAFVPAEQSPTGTPVVYLGCYVTEGPSGLAWVDLKDGRKLGGKKWVGGQWTAAPFLARDAGTKAVPGVHVYVGSAWETGKKTGEAELRITAITKDGDKPVLVHPLGKASFAKGFEGEMGGIAIQDGILAASLPPKNQILFVDAREGKVLGTATVEAPRGVAFDAKGGLLVVSGSKLLRYASIQQLEKLPAPETLVGTGLEEPVGLTLDSSGLIYISDHGKSHQVKVFSEKGKLVKTIGKAGAPAAGPYDPLHMNNPAGMAVDSDQQLWVTEDDALPKRVSVWSGDGKLIRAFYGPAKYGGGGALDPQDKTRFYYADGSGAMEFKLDWQEGKYALTNVYYRRGPEDLKLPVRSGAPETVLYHGGCRYFTNAYNSSPTGGHDSAFVFVERDGIARPAAGMGNASTWDILKTDAFRSKWPAGTDFNIKHPSKQKALFIWSDLNEDAQVQPDEVTFQGAQAGGITVMPDLSFCASRLDEKAVQYVPVGFSKSGIPRYDLNQGKVLAEGVQGPASSGGNQTLAFGNGWTAITLGIKPFSSLSVSGAKDGVPKWSYASPWPGLHASHRAPRPDHPGQLIGTTRLPGGPFGIKGSDAGPFWALHSNHGTMAIFTYDGLFVANLFKDMRSGKIWRMPSAIRDMNLEEVTLGEENFWPTITSTSDGKVYLVDGARSALVRIDGMESVRRLPIASLKLTKAELDKARTWQAEAEAARQSLRGDEILHVALRKSPPVVDGKLEDWAAADWAEIDKRGVKANFNSTSKPYDFSAAVAVAGDRLFAAWKTGEEKLLQNSGELPVAPFKTGGALDLMISTNRGADENRKGPVAGDQRLLVTVIGGKPKALLYQAVVAGTKEAEKIPFSSPSRTITFDRVDDVSGLVEFAANAGDYEISIPLSALKLKPESGLKVKGDVGVLRGNGTETTTRIYWHNKATSIVSDVPDEATLTPNLWGTWEFKNE